MLQWNYAVKTPNDRPNKDKKMKELKRNCERLSSSKKKEKM